MKIPVFVERRDVPSPIVVVVANVPYRATCPFFPQFHVDAETEMQAIAGLRRCIKDHLGANVTFTETEI